MICDLCLQDSNRVIRAASWQVCQWCVSNRVLEHALEIEVDITRLREAGITTGATHRRDVTKGTAAETTLKRAYVAYADLTTAPENS